MNADQRARLDRAVAEALGLEAPKPAAPGRSDTRKLVVAVPREALEPVRSALFAAGAGRIGAYQHCSWYVAGTGTFLGGAGSSPTVGEPGREERVAELRLETVYPRAAEGTVIEALLAAHPYEEPAFDLYPLANVDLAASSGFVGRLAGDPEQLLGELGVAPVFRRRAARGERVAVFTGPESPCRADCVIASAGEPDVLAPTLEAWALERVGGV